MHRYVLVCFWWLINVGCVGYWWMSYSRGPVHLKLGVASAASATPWLVIKLMDDICWGPRRSETDSQARNLRIGLAKALCASHKVQTPPKRCGQVPVYL